MRRYAKDAGYSWRKWEDPLMVRPDNRLRNVLFWLVCADLGALAALVIR